MKTITAIKTQKRRKDRVSIFLDGEYAISLGSSVAEEAGLASGQQLSCSQVEQLAQTDVDKACLDAAWRYLSYRPRSEAELRLRLRRRGFEADAIDRAVLKLKEQGLVDDAAFARFWRENRESFSPRSRGLIMQELRRKGVDAETLSQVTRDADDDHSAYQAALGKARQWRDKEAGEFRSRLQAFLRRRGFSYDVIGHTIDRLWQERGRE